MKSPGTLIFSLTDAGLAIAGKLQGKLPHITSVHRPEDLSSVLVNAFVRGQPCIFIGACAIVLRILARSIHDKHSEPPVVVIAESGGFVIPLLAGHEGGGDELAWQVADSLDAHVVFTAAHQYHRPVYVLGMGCERGCPGGTLAGIAEEAIIRARNSLYDFQKFELAAIASIDIKHDESGIIEFAGSQSLPLHFYSAKVLQRRENQLSAKSEAVFRAVGCHGVAEAAALSKAGEITGQRAELLVNKLKNSRATAAVARSYRQQ